MRKVTVENILAAIDGLPKDRVYNYVNSTNHGCIRVVCVFRPAGPVQFKRWDPTKKKTEHDAKVENISYSEILRIANAFREGEPINVDRILGGSYNTRSVLESLLAHTPEFYPCYPGRIQEDGESIQIKKGHKHIIWVPDHPHQNGCLGEAYETDDVVSEIPPRQVVYSGLEITYKRPDFELDNGFLRRHSQMQIAAYFIGHQLNYHTWIAQNDCSIRYNDMPIKYYDGVIESLNDCPSVKNFPGACEAGKLIDCMWLTSRDIPAVMEVEHSTKVTRGLTRMLNFSRKIPQFKNTRYVIIASEKDRNLVKRECNKEIFQELEPMFFPYMAVEELYDLCHRRNIRGVSPEFLDCFMEPMLS